MALAKNPVVRLVVPLVLLAAGVFIAWAVMRNSLSGPARRASQSAPTTAPAPAPATNPAPPAPAPANTPSAVPAPAPGSDGATPGTPPAQPADQAASTPPATTPSSTPAPAAQRTLRVRPWPGPEPRFDDLGALDPGGPMRMRLRFAPIGAGLEALELANHFQTVEPSGPHEMLQRREISRSAPGVQLVPFAANAVRIDGRAVNIAFATGDGVAPGSAWRQLAPGSFEAVIEDDAGAAVARITRTWKLAPDSYELVLDQRVENLSDKPFTAEWIQTGPTDLAIGVVRYGGDKRRVRFGFLLDPAADPAQTSVVSMIAPPGMFEHTQAMAAGPTPLQPATLWPNERSTNRALVWAAMANRYFAVSVHRPPPVDPTTPRRLAWSKVERVGIADGQEAPRPEFQAVMALVLTSEPQAVAPGATADFSLGVYAGPASTSIIRAEPTAAALGLDRIVVYILGAIPCFSDAIGSLLRGFCAFQPIAHLLRWYLGGVHWLVGDWAIAIILLVVTIRTILHPITKWSQVNIQRFGKQMAELAPKQKAIQEKYKNDQAKLREETGRLMREANVNYSGLLGCLPLFLMIPIWYALSAMLFFTFELRHDGAFYGLFQAFTPSWRFLADLAEPDHLVGFGRAFYIPLISGIMGPIDSFNILPFIQAGVFYFHQKYLSPAPSAAMTPEQLAQQRMAKWITVIAVPLFMYNAPAGLTLYFITNSLLAIAESHYIRKHVEALDKKAAAEGRKPWERPTRAGKPAGGARPQRQGFLARLAERVEQQRKMMEEMKAEQARRERNQRGKGGR